MHNGYFTVLIAEIGSRIQAADSLGRRSYLSSRVFLAPLFCSTRSLACQVPEFYRCIGAMEWPYNDRWIGLTRW